MSAFKSPFTDRVGLDAVPTRGSKSGSYDSPEVPGGPGRDGGLLAELHRDHVAGPPTTSGPLKSPFKDVIGG